jgi:hypothetical protein
MRGRKLHPSGYSHSVLIFQSIISTHKSFADSTDYQKIYRDILDTTIDAAETIVQCTKHMKTIVDGNYLIILRDLSAPLL